MRLLIGGCAVIGCLVSPFAGFGEDSPATTSQKGSLFQEDFLTDGTGLSLESARGAFFDVDVSKAGERIRTAARQLRDGASTLAEDSRDSLHEAAQDLEKLAVHVEELSIESVREFDRRVARTFHTIAQHHVHNGGVAWQAREQRLAGRRLRAAADNFETALRLSGQRKRYCPRNDQGVSDDVGKAHRGERLRCR